MADEKPLRQLQDDVYPSEMLNRVVVSFGGYPLILNTYAYILGVLGVGEYRDQQQSSLEAVDWGDQHFTCFQIAYDWRRDIVESARRLDLFIKEKKAYVEKELERRFGITDDPVFTDNLLYLLLESPRNARNQLVMIVSSNIIFR